MMPILVAVTGRNLPDESAHATRLLFFSANIQTNYYLLERLEGNARSFLF